MTRFASKKHAEPHKMKPHVSVGFRGIWPHPIQSQTYINNSMRMAIQPYAYYSIDRVWT